MVEAEGRNMKYVYRCSQRSWSEMPPELLWEIGSRNDTALDAAQFRSVCKPWRSALPKYYSHGFQSCTPLPLPRPPSMFQYVDYFPDSGSFIITHSTVYALRPQCTCEEGAQDKRVVGRCNDSTNTSIKFVVFENIGCGDSRHNNYYLPRTMYPDCIFMDFPLVFDMSNLDALPISKFYRLNYAHHFKVDDNSLTSGGGEQRRRVHRSMFSPGGERLMDKVVPFYDHDDGRGGDRCAVVAGVLALSREGKLAVLRLVGLSPSLTPDLMGWRPISYRPNPDLEFFRFDDIAEYHGEICILDSRGCALFLTSCRDLDKLTPIASPPPPCSEANYSMRWRKRLVLGQSGDLFLLLPCKHFVDQEWHVRILIYKLRLLGITSQKTKEPGEWVPVESFGDQAFFVGRDLSFSAPASSLFSGDERNGDCLIISGSSFWPYITCDVPNLRDGLFSQLPTGGIYSRVYEYRTGHLKFHNFPEIDYPTPCGFYRREAASN